MRVASTSAAGIAAILTTLTLGSCGGSPPGTGSLATSLTALRTATDALPNSRAYRLARAESGFITAVVGEVDKEDGVGNRIEILEIHVDDTGRQVLDAQPARGPVPHFSAYAPTAEDAITKAVEHVPGSQFESAAYVTESPGDTAQSGWVVELRRADGTRGKYRVNAYREVYDHDSAQTR